MDEEKGDETKGKKGGCGNVGGGGAPGVASGASRLEPLQNMSGNLTNTEALEQIRAEARRRNIQHLEKASGLFSQGVEAALGDLRARAKAAQAARDNGNDPIDPEPQEAAARDPPMAIDPEVKEYVQKEFPFSSALKHQLEPDGKLRRNWGEGGFGRG